MFIFDQNNYSSINYHTMLNPRQQTLLECVRKHGTISVEELAQQLNVTTQTVRRDVKAMVDADLAFHGAIYRAAGNPLIEQSASLHWHHIRRAMGLALREASLRESVWDEHQAIAEAIAAGQADRAERLMRQHCGKASAYMVALLAASPSGASGASSVAARRKINSVVR